jgi:uncharacterized protein (TIRG00374 family)
MLAQPLGPMKLRKATLVSLAFLLIGIGFLGALLSHFDMSGVLANLRNVGWAFAAGFAVSALANACAARAWLVLIGPPSARPRFADVLGAQWAGMALNQITPGAALGEVLKGSMLAGRASSRELTASLVMFNLLDIMTSQAANLIAPLFCLIVLPWRIPLAMLALGVAFLLPLWLLFSLLHWGATSRFVRLLGKLPIKRLQDAEGLKAWASSVDQTIREYRTLRRREFRHAIVCLFGVRLLQIFELIIYLRVLMPATAFPVILALAFLAQNATQLLGWVASIFPGLIGVVESSGAGLFRLVGFEPTVGLALMLVRRARWLLGIVVGLVIGLFFGLGRGPTRPVPSTEKPDQTMAAE